MANPKATLGYYSTGSEGQDSSTHFLDTGHRGQAPPSEMLPTLGSWPPSPEDPSGPDPWTKAHCPPRRREVNLYPIQSRGYSQDPDLEVWSFGVLLGVWWEAEFLHGVNSHPTLMARSGDSHPWSSSAGWVSASTFQLPLQRGMTLWPSLDLLEERAACRFLAS